MNIFLERIKIIALFADLFEMCIMMLIFFTKKLI